MPVSLDAIEPELEEKFVTAGGPGGQNVNKVATAVQLRFNVGASAALTDEEKARIRRALASRLTEEGDLVLFIQTHRSQIRNREEARARLVEMLEKALVRPKRRIATRPTRASKERRLEGKAKRSRTKSNRGKVQYD
ncbi:MAG: alternative ribosome rescue aminoacyl-tRNA hydrolase ArfB [Hyphomonadaceae bacterium]